MRKILLLRYLEVNRVRDEFSAFQGICFAGREKKRGKLQRTGGQLSFLGSEMYSRARSMAERRSPDWGAGTISLMENWGTGPMNHLSIELATRPDIRYSFTSNTSCRGIGTVSVVLNRFVSKD